MPFDSLALAAVTGEILEKVRGDRLNAVHQPEPLTLMLTFSHKRRLLMSAHPEFARAYLASHDLTRPQQPPNFCMLLRKHLEGARLRDVRQVGFDRVLEMDFQGAEDRFTLVAELMGRHSNILLVGSDGMLRGVIKPVPASVNRYRELNPGSAYVPPPLSGRSNPLEGDQEELVHKLIQEGTGKLLRSAMGGAWTGMSPVLVRWLLERSGLGEEEAVSGGARQQESLIESLGKLREIVERGSYHPGIFRVEGRVDAWALPLPGPGVESSASSMSEALEKVFEERIGSREMEALRSQVLAALKSGVDREKRKLEDFRKVMEEASQVGQIRQWAEALLAYQSLAPAGSSHVQMPGPAEDENSQLSIPLDPDLSPVENAQQYFTRARHAERAAKQVQKLAEVSRPKLEGMQKVLEAAARAASIGDLYRAVEGIPSEWGLRELIPERGRERERVPSRKEPQARAESSLPPGVRRVVARSGHEILFGRSSVDNDFLTTRLARPNDLWLHVRGETSAHVVIRTNNQPERVPRETLLEAANLAACHSASKHSSYVAVDYTLRKYVVKRRGSPPGTVEYRGEKTLHVQPQLGKANAAAS